MGRDEPVVVVLDGQQVAGSEVLGADPLVPRDPLGRDDGTRAGQQRHLAEGDRCVRVVHGGHDRDGPGPAAVAGLGGREVVGGRADGGVARDVLGVHPEGLADLAGLVVGRLDRSSPREIDRVTQARWDGPLLRGIAAQVRTGGGVGEVVHAPDCAARVEGAGRQPESPGPAKIREPVRGERISDVPCSGSLIMGGRGVTHPRPPGVRTFGACGRG